MLELTPNLFSYKMFTSPTTQITEDDLCNALRIYQDFWTKKDLKLAVKKVGLTKSIKQKLKSCKNPLTSYFNNTNDDAEFIILRSYDLDSKYMTPEEYQSTLYNPVAITNMYTFKQQTQFVPTVKLELFLTILKRYPRTTQSHILIKYLKQTIKDN